jgi:hypothetical protein
MNITLLKFVNGDLRKLERYPIISMMALPPKTPQTPPKAAYRNADSLAHELDSLRSAPKMQANVVRIRPRYNKDAIFRVFFMLELMSIFKVIRLVVSGVFRLIKLIFVLITNFIIPCLASIKFREVFAIKVVSTGVGDRFIETIAVH